MDLKKDIVTALTHYMSRAQNDGLLGIKPDVAAESIAEKAWDAKEELRDMMRKHPDWNEELQAWVLHGTRFETCNIDKVFEWSWCLLRPALHQGILNYTETRFIAHWMADGENNWANEVELIAQEKFPNAFRRDGKRNRIFRKILMALGVWDDSSGSVCQELYAKVSDMMSARRIDFDLVVSIHPAHFMTMSNPHDDSRGETLVSCHSLDCADYEYRNGCAGYATDSVTMIAFTCKDIWDADSIYTRKTFRQLFMYEPGSGYLLQSRAYNTSGGTHERLEIGEAVRNMVQYAIAQCENRVNLWKITELSKLHGINIYKHPAFSGYADWLIDDFHAVMSIHHDVDHTGYSLEVGNEGICLRCGKPSSDDILCGECWESTHCALCGGFMDNGTEVHLRDGRLANICKSCLNHHAEKCSSCGEWYHDSLIYDTEDGLRICCDCQDKGPYKYCMYSGLLVDPEEHDCYNHCNECGLRTGGY